MRTRLIASLLFPVVLASACVSTPADRSLISLRRANLSLAFSNPDLDAPIAPERIVEVVQRVLPVGPAQAPTASASRPVPTIPPIEICPAPPEGAVPSEPAFLSVREPRPGFYSRLNEGTITVTSGPTELTLPYPPLTLVEVRNVRRVTGERVLPVGEAPWHVHWEVVEQLAPGISETVEYRFDQTAIELVRREVTNELGTTVFQPATPVRVLELAPPGRTWQSVGSDPATGGVRAVTGTVRENEVVDLCGERVDAIPATTDVHDVDVRGASTYSTDVGEQNVTHWATQFGALVVRNEIHATEVIRTDEGAFTITYDVVGHLYSTDPVDVR